MIRRTPRTRLFLHALEDRRTPATFTVTTAAESGAGSLRQAITDSNANLADGPDLINFDAGVFGSAQTISILTALPTIQDNVSIVGPGSKLLTINRNAAGDNVRLLTVGNTSKLQTVTISGITLSGGKHETSGATQIDNGGGLFIGSEDVTLTDVVVSNCTSNQQGGGIAVGPAGSLTMVNCTVSGNQALGTVGGITDLFGVVFSGIGGGVYFTYDGILNMTGCTISGNSAKHRGGGVYLYADKNLTATIRNSTISGNKALSVSPSYFFDGGGGGISAQFNPLNSGSLTLTIQNSTVYQNSAPAGEAGGGVFASSNKIAVNIESSVVSGNTAGTGPDISATKAITLNTSAVGVTTGFTFTGSNNLPAGANLKLGALQNNGGSVATHMPAFDFVTGANNSPLVDAGSNPASLTSDARGLARSYDNPAVAGTRTVDIGAAEAQPSGLPTAVGSATDVTVAGGTSHTVTVTYADDTAINVSTLGTNDITVTGPAGFNTKATFVKVDVGTNGTPRVATYTFSPPGGDWNAADSGTYTISVNAGEVTDTSGNAVPAGAVGTFKVLLPRSLVVTNKNDSGPGSLRQAILDANALTPSQDSITFSSFFSTPQTITMSSSMTIADSVKIIGPGATLLTLDGNFVTRHLIIDGPGVLNVEISGMLLTNGRTANKFQSERGGSVTVNGENVTMTDVFLAGNAAQQSYGGAIHLQGQASLTFKNGRITGNSAPEFGGGGISALDPGHAITITDSLVSGNSTGFFGGGIFSFAGGTVAITRSTLGSNTTTKVDDQGGTVFGGGGGGLMMGDGVTGGTLTVLDSTFDANNTAGSGGGIVFTGSTPGVVIRNSTFANNKAAPAANGVGGGILVGNLLLTPFTVENSTFAFNQAYSGGGLFVGNNDGGSVSLKSSIFAQNTAVVDPGVVDVDGAAYAEFCLFGVADGVGLDPSSHDNVSGNVSVPIDPMFGPLDFNGGPTRTLPLLAGSPAIDVGSNPAGLAFDQRGAGFPRLSGAAPDIGAFETQGVTAPTVTEIKINDGSAQRSRVTSITVTFSTLVSLGGGIPEQAFQLQRTGPGAPVNSVGLSVDLSGSTGTQTVAKITFSGPLTQGNGTLIDGDYTLTVFAAAVVDSASTPMSADVVSNLHRLYGDVDGDRDVDAVDFGQFRIAFGGSSNLAFDFDGDGDVDAVDFGQFRIRFGSSLP